MPPSEQIFAFVKRNSTARSIDFGYGTQLVLRNIEQSPVAPTEVINHLHLDSDLVVVVYSVGDICTFKEAVGYWVEEIRENLGDAKIVLMGNKTDEKAAMS